AAVVATMFFAPAHRGSVASPRTASSSVRLAGREAPNGAVLEDGVFIAVSVNSQYVSFQPV
ncbi:MAG: hypothetical protein ACREMU_04290, partial [Gemmatimonadaceae bacterium]